MPTFPRGFTTYATNVANAQLIAKLARTTDSDLNHERTKGFAPTPADSAALRGIPAIGRGVAGAIRFTIPHLHDIPDVTQ